MHGPKLDDTGQLASANLHIQNIRDAISPLAHLIYGGPWGIGFSAMCLLTSNVPVQIIYRQSNGDPVAAAAYWHIYLPLDPHRLLYLPGRMHAARRDLMKDHRIGLDGFLGVPLNQTMIEGAARHVIFHPEHDPMPRLGDLTSTFQRRGRGDEAQSTMIFDYAPLRVDLNVDRRSLDEHVETPSHGRSAPKSSGHRDIQDTAEVSFQRMMKARAEFTALANRHQDVQPSNRPAPDA